MVSGQELPATVLPNIVLKIEYDGSSYVGWQRQPDGPSIQGTIEDVLSSILKEKVFLQGSGRTDSGVHAKAQYAMFRGSHKYSAESWARMLNFHLPSTIRILESREMPHHFHVQRYVISKTYEYRLLNRPCASPLNPGVLFYPRKLNWEKMEQALPAFVGEHDFKAFQGAKAESKTSVRTIFKLALHRDTHELYRFEIQGNGFLKHMVRNIVGTVLEVGEGKRDPQEIPEIIASRDRRRAGRTAPPEGLCLTQVVYPAHFGLSPD